MIARASNVNPIDTNDSVLLESEFVAGKPEPLIPGRTSPESKPVGP